MNRAGTITREIDTEPINQSHANEPMITELELNASRYH